MGSLASRRNALLVSLGWWLLRRRLRRRARAALAAVPGHTVSRTRRRGRPLLLLGVLAGGGYAAWHRRFRSRGAGSGGHRSLSDAAPAEARPPAGG